MHVSFNWIDNDASKQEIIDKINNNLMEVQQALSEFQWRLDNLERLARDHQHANYINRGEIDDLHAHLKYFCNDLLRQEGYILGRCPDEPTEPMF